jgi:Domain of unknown function (DUF4188)
MLLASSTWSSVFSSRPSSIGGCDTQNGVGRDARGQSWLEVSTKTTVTRRTVDLSSYPDLVVIYLGMRVNRLAGIKTLFGFGPKISTAVEAQPDGLLLHENVVWSVFPPHAGMRQYWRDFESLERWARSKPHQLWWQNFVRNSGGTGFWHETYLMRGGMEAVYDDLPMPYGMMKFAPVVAAHGSMFSARRRAAIAGQEQLQSAVSEAEFSAAD